MLCKKPPELTCQQHIADFLNGLPIVALEVTQQ